jgi:cyanuric acid amidohydrolase
MSGPDDVSGLLEALDTQRLRAEDIIAVLGKTEGNGCVNDFTRGFSVFAFAVALGERLGISWRDVEKRVAFVMSGGTEGVMSPHATVFTTRQEDGPPTGAKRLAVGATRTRDFLPEEQGRMPMVTETARAVHEAMAAAGVDDPADVHFVQVKCPLLTSDRIDEARQRGDAAVTEDTYESMGYTRAASALGVALALGEVDADALSDAVIHHDWNLYSRVASTSAGVELLNNEIILMGNSPKSSSELVIGHSVMRDAIDARAVREALSSVGITAHGSLDDLDCSRVVNVFAKAEADPSGMVRGRRHTMLNDSDINQTRHARAVVNAVIASVVADPMVYVSGGAEHQGPPGGGPVAVIARAE